MFFQRYLVKRNLPCNKKTCKADKPTVSILEFEADVYFLSNFVDLCCYKILFP